MEEKRSSKIEIRVTPREKEMIKKRAYKSLLSVSDYSRMMLINGNVNLIKVDDLVQLKRIGTNINQIAKALHFTSHIKFDDMKKNLELLSIEIDKIKQNTIPLDSENIEK